MRGELISREESLSGDLNRARRANKLLKAIEAHCTYIRNESRRVVAAYLLEGAENFERCFDLHYIDSIKQMAVGCEALRLSHFERYAPHWRALLPTDPELLARLINLFSRKYGAGETYAPQVWANLRAAAPEVRAAYQALYHRPLTALDATAPSPIKDSADVLEQIETWLEWLTLGSGEILFRDGEPGDALYVVISGRIRVLSAGQDGRAEATAEVGRGELLGEMGVLTGAVRIATAKAIRDSELVRLSRAGLFALAKQHLEVMVRINTLLAHRLTTQDGRCAQARNAAHTFTLLPCAAGTPLQTFGRELAEALARFGPTIYVTSTVLEEALGPGAAQASLNDARNAQIVSWLTELEIHHQYVVFEAAPELSEWSRRCVRQADCVLLVGMTGATPQPAAHETALLAGGEQRTELILLQNAGTIPWNAAAWLAARAPGSSHNSFGTALPHHLVRLGDSLDVLHLARRLTGRALGLVLSGGGARGFGHIGALRAIRELDIVVDAVGGASMGAFMGAMYAAGMDDQIMLELAIQHGSRGALLDRTLPFFSFYASHKVTSQIRKFLGDQTIEDLPLPFFCVSANLSQGRQMVHTSGSVWQAVRASMAAAPIFTPFLSGDDLLVDGGFLNNIPVDIMRPRPGIATVIGVDASPLSSKTQAYDFGPGISTWEALRYRFAPVYKRKRPPGILAVFAQIMDINGMYRQTFVKDQADLIVHLPLRGWGMLDFDDRSEIIETSYRAALTQLAAWKEKQ
jgi:predicted acylesterase/phospholipase RssA/CRP-like cAMP-binding protein